MKFKLIVPLAGLLVAPAGFGQELQPVQEEPAAVAAAPAPTREEDQAPATYDVFIDGVSGYAFVRTPKGWTFVRDLKAEAR